MNVDILFSDEFKVFSQNITDLGSQKKELQAEFTQIKADFQSKISAVNKEAQVLQAEFEAWQESKGKGAESFEILKAQKLSALETPQKAE